MPIPLIHKRLLLEKYPAKGGWTYARLPGISKDKRAHFGTIRVNGTVDGYELKQYNLFPMSDGHMLLPVKAAIRKQIKKEAGDYVEVILYTDYETIEVPENFQCCLEDEPIALQQFNLLPQEEKSRLLKWIEEPLSDDSRIERMAKAITALASGYALPHQ
jgi:hypothetical protein